MTCLLIIVLSLENPKDPKFAVCITTYPMLSNPYQKVSDVILQKTKAKAHFRLYASFITL